MITSSAHLEIALGENEDTCYTVENDEFSEKNRYEEYPVYLPRQCLRDVAKSLDFIGFLGWKRRIYTLFIPLEDRIGRNSKDVGQILRLFVILSR